MFDFTECPPGYFNPYYNNTCSSPCGQPTYGPLCGSECDCLEEDCHHVIGCPVTTTMTSKLKQYHLLCVFHETQRHLLHGTC